MKKNYLLIAAGLLCAVSMQAQKKVVASLDFDDPSQKGAFKTTWAVTPDLGQYGYIWQKMPCIPVVTKANNLLR